MSAVQTVLNLKEVIEKEIESSGGGSNIQSPSSMERCSDVLRQLKDVAMSFDILNETLIGATVNKLKKHSSLGATAKDLIKSWKQLVASTSTSSISSGNDEKPKAAPPSHPLPTKAAAPSERRNSAESSHNDDDEDVDQNNQYDPKTEWAGLSSQRQTVCQKLYTIFVSVKPKLRKDHGVSEKALINLLGPRTLEIETAIYTKYKTDTKGYADKARSLIFNLSKNASLSISILLGHVEPEELLSYTTEQLASEEKRRQRQQTAQRLIDSKRLDWNEANEEKINSMCGIQGDLLNASLFTCGRCKSIKTTSTQKQTRSADEPMTVFVLCLNCGKRWKC